MASSFGSRSEAVKVVGAWLVCLTVLCGLWLAAIFYFLGNAQRASSIRLGADRIRIRELEARRAEKDFLMRSLADRDFFEHRRSEYLERHREHVRALRAEIRALGEKMHPARASEDDALLAMVDRYETGFRALVDAYHERGFDRSGGVGALLTTREELARTIAADDEVALERALRRLANEEQRFLRVPGDANAARVATALDELRGATDVARAERRGEREIGELLARYEARFSSLLELERRIGFTEELGLQGELREAIHAVEPAVERILDDAVEADETATRTLIVGILVACLIMAVLLTLAIFFAQTARLRNKKLVEMNRQLEEEHRRMLQAERLAAIGQMVAGLAHESRNAFQRTHACLDMLSHEVADRSEALALVARIEESQDHIHLLYEQVREYAAPLRLNRESVRLPDVVRAAWTDLELSRTGRAARLTQDEGDLDLECEVDPFSLEQVFRNILENALAACSDPVEIRVRYRETRSATGSVIEVVVADNGPGLTAEQRERMFEPFFTTKTRGTGLGMAIVKRLVEAHGGAVSAGDAGVEGTEIRIELPRGRGGRGGSQ